jgi:hypothetical protein
MPAMRSALRLLAVAALLASSGLPAALLQSAAWASMAARNLKTATPAAALANALDGRHECSVCLKAQRLAQVPMASIGEAGRSRLHPIFPLAAVRAELSSRSVALAARSFRPISSAAPAVPLPPPRLQA